VEHQGQKFETLEMPYAGRTNVFGCRFEAPQAAKDFEVLDVTVTASQAPVGNFGMHRKTYKLVP
jgi:hypothetical protein